MLPAIYRTYPGITWDHIEQMPRAERLALLDDLTALEAAALAVTADQDEGVT